MVIALDLRKDVLNIMTLREPKFHLSGSPWSMDIRQSEVLT